MINTVMYNESKLHDKNYIESSQASNFKNFEKLFKVQ
jgi:hypothetical protein